MLEVTKKQVRRSKKALAAHGEGVKGVWQKVGVSAPAPVCVDTSEATLSDGLIPGSWGVTEQWTQFIG